MRIQIFIAGDPVAQGRPRFSSKGRDGKPLPFVKTYDPAKSKSFKETVKWQAIEQGANKKLLEGPLKMTLVLRLQRPKGHSGKKGLRPSAPTHHITKPDLDNMTKLICDALEGVCYARDQQICEGYQRKEYVMKGLMPGVLITIEEIGE